MNNAAKHTAPETVLVEDGIRVILERRAGEQSVRLQGYYGESWVAGNVFVFAQDIQASDGAIDTAAAALVRKIKIWIPKFDALAAQSKRSRVH